MFPRVKTPIAYSVPHARLPHKSHRGKHWSARQKTYKSS